MVPTRRRPGGLREERPSADLLPIEQSVRALCSQTRRLVAVDVPEPPALELPVQLRADEGREHLLRERVADLLALLPLLLLVLPHRLEGDGRGQQFVGQTGVLDFAAVDLLVRALVVLLVPPAKHARLRPRYGGRDGTGLPGGPAGAQGDDRTPSGFRLAAQSLTAGERVRPD